VTLTPDDLASGLSLERISDAGHFMQLERPERVIESTLKHFAL
jgi:pimeloyl-ACP methyl ester carboxylesterase